MCDVEPKSLYLRFREWLCRRKLWHWDIIFDTTYHPGACKHERGFVTMRVRCRLCGRKRLILPVG